MTKYLLENGTHATNRGRSGPASRGPSSFLGVTCWSLLGGIGNARWNEGVRRVSGGRSGVSGGRPRPGRRLLPDRGQRPGPSLRGRRRTGGRAGVAGGRGLRDVGGRPRSRDG